MFVPSRQYDSQSGTKFYDYSNDSPYDNFMRKHLQHYGYYTGKNEKRLKGLDSWQDQEVQPDYKEYGFEDDYLNEALKSKERTPPGPEKELNSNQVVYNVNDGKVITKLKEPRALFSIAPDPGFHPPKWPIELEVLPERVTHIYDNPGPEPFNQPTGFEPSPTILGEEGGGRLVFSYEPVISPFFIKSRIGGAKTLSTCQARLESETDDTLQFESRFECGNLRKAYQVAPTEYELWLRTDLYTSKHTQWFYFRVSNTRPGQLYRFTLVNFYKSASLYNEGLRPLMYSERAAADKGVGWRRCGGNIKYFRSNKRYPTAAGDKYFYSLTWQIRFEHSEDTVYFAHCYPYTYSDLVDYLQKLQDDPVKSQFCKQRVLCRSLAGNAVHLLTIGTGPTQTQQQQQQLTDDSAAPPAPGGAATASGWRQPPQSGPQKKVILITSRVHPGESNASWMMKGFLDFITGDSADARLLRDNFTFKVVPMINPDGVIVGNYRCSLTGRDLNRNYKTVLKDSFPAVYAIVELVKKLQASREVALYCDLHGHSRRQNVFIYGCEDRDAREDRDRLLERVFPAMLSKNSPEKFCYEYCKFKMQKSKEGTGRIVMYNLGVRNSFTMEATFCGSTLSRLKGQHFNCRHLEAMGAHFCDTLLDYFDPSPAKNQEILLQVEHKLKEQILVNLQRSGRCPNVVSVDELSLAEISDEDVESSDGGSDSSASNGLPVHYEFMKSQMSQQERRKVRQRRSRKERTAAAAAAKAGKPAKPMCPHNAGASGGAKPNKSKPAVLSAPSKTSSSASAAVATTASATSAGSGVVTRSASSMAGAARQPKGTVERAGPPSRLKSVVSDPNLQPVLPTPNQPVDPDTAEASLTAQLAPAGGTQDAQSGTQSLCARHHQLADFERIAGQQQQTRTLPGDASNLLRIYSYQRSNAVANNYTLETIEYLLAARESEQRLLEPGQFSRAVSLEDTSTLAATSGQSRPQQQPQSQHLLHKRSSSTNLIAGGSSAGTTAGRETAASPQTDQATTGRLLASRHFRGTRVGGLRQSNRRLNSASPSYPAHSVPVHIAPEERQTYQLEWNLSQQQVHANHAAADAATIDDESPQHQPAAPRHQHQQEIAQTASHPTVTVSSSTRPPLPISAANQQHRPAMISLHMTSSPLAAAGAAAAARPGSQRRVSLPGARNVQYPQHHGYQR
ncbi:hypothetical protein BOX15_Mlig033678g1 [Macrostomum lignano]|uniref:Peptidase M14 domain-containing protein n=1 Tax=Macrostomum lignano TaxID=282301 RepID=A0A267EPJ2_9PLAT|nr:hypothetical protein BOX15_Mlig033678g1 [Macrostomum lignano]